MNTLQERYCAAQHCPAGDFNRRLFWLCLHRHAVPLAICRPGWFAADYELIALAARARTMRELNDEIRDFIHDGRNRSCWRGRVRLRLSTRRLRSVARQYLPSALPLPLEKSRRHAA